MYGVAENFSPTGVTQNSMAPVGMRQQKLLMMLFLVIFCSSFRIFECIYLWAQTFWEWDWIVALEGFQIWLPCSWSICVKRCSIWFSSFKNQLVSFSLGCRSWPLGVSDRSMAKTRSRRQEVPWMVSLLVSFVDCMFVRCWTVLGGSLQVPHHSLQWALLS